MSWIAFSYVLGFPAERLAMRDKYEIYFHLIFSCFVSLIGRGIVQFLLQPVVHCLARAEGVIPRDPMPRKLHECAKMIEFGNLSLSERNCKRNWFHTWIGEDLQISIRQSYVACRLVEYRFKSS